MRGVGLPLLGVPMGGGELNALSPAITPTLSAELLANGSMETGSPPSSWLAFNSAVLSSQADERTGGAGSKSMGVARNGAADPYAAQVEAVTLNQWFYMTAWQKNIDASGGLQAKFFDGSAIPVLCGGPDYQTGTSWVQVHGTGRSTQTTSGVARLYVNANADSQSARFDDVSLKSITFASMLVFIGARGAVVGHYECHPTITIGTHAGLVVRYLDANNFVLALINRGLGRASLWKVVAGIWTAVIAETAITYAAAAPLRVTISGTGTTYSLYYNDAQVGTDQTISDTLGTGVYGFSAYAGNEVGQVTTRPFDYTFFAVGDSKTPAAGYQPYLTQNLIASTGRHWSERPNRFAVNGGSVADLHTYVDANLASVTTSPAPHYILINLGANDVKDSVFPGLTEVGVKADYSAIIEAFHTTWPNAKIYLMRIWRIDGAIPADPANIAAFDGWVDDLIALYDYVYAGPDERIFLENGDNGATYTLDGTHPNPAGYALTAVRWQAVMGY